MGFGPPEEEDDNIWVAAARPKALPMAEGRTIGKRGWLMADSQTICRDATFCVSTGSMPAP